ncbi:MAG: YjjG family noncanonical pyrimidine nucleotidase [Peptoniphilus sp.]|uniref:YjjG family noncanonical pyrimidine nucleotidase n=1 Tax=Peptoniphilus sp. TaxID=1971214 RepID=UPI002A75EA5E|nr:YjjG family noncanonical pyrimidine nucleotidase [Peptoniphilus sp.]MDY2986009.1 YjjG family noncanonical pyrimidine nucleotidase [Peptoniphilus sp.]
MYKIILIDLDNTILDFNAAEENSIRYLFEIYGVENNRENLEKYRKINVYMWGELEKGNMSKDEILTKRFEEFFKLFGIEVDGKKAEDVFRSHLDRNSQLIDGAFELLLELKKMDKKIYTASNGVYSTQIKRMTDSKIYNLFDGHFISEKVGFEKPDRRFFEYCFKNIDGANLKNMLMVGDRIESDINGAKNFGIDSCYFDKKGIMNESLATHTINHLSDLLKIV